MTKEQVDKVLEVGSRLPLIRHIIVIDMKGLRRYDDPRIISFEEVERLGRRLHERHLDLFGSLVEATEPDDVAVMVYTSGTTGVPKGAMITHRNMTAMIRGLSAILAFSQKDSFVSALPLCHIAELLRSQLLQSGKTTHQRRAVPVDCAASAEMVRSGGHICYQRFYEALPIIELQGGVIVLFIANSAGAFCAHSPAAERSSAMSGVYLAVVGQFQQFLIQAIVEL